MSGQITIYPSTVQGVLKAPPSKSVAQRALAAATLAQGLSVIRDAGESQDVVACLSACRELGAKVKGTTNELRIAGGMRPPKGKICCGESGLALRMLSCLAATLDRPVILTGKGSLLDRPMDVVTASLHALGVECRSTRGKPPLWVHGPFRRFSATIDASLSSQVLTGLLMAAPLTGKSMRFTVSRLHSRPYIDTTIQLMEAFGVGVHHQSYQEFFIDSPGGYQATDFRVEGDWSAAAFLLVAGAVAGRVRVRNLHPQSTQADRVITDVLRMAGAGMIRHADGWESFNRPLHGFRWDATHCPDLFPPLVVLAAYCAGQSRIHGVTRLHAKESDRASALARVFGRMGVAVRCEGDLMVVEGRRPQPAVVDAHGDHRMAMAAAVAALGGRGPVGITGAEAAAKSYPAFFTDLADICRAGSIHPNQQPSS